MANIEIIKGPSYIAQSFTTRYGQIGEHLNEETWLSWFGIWYSAWEEATRYMTRLTEELKDAYEELSGLLAEMDTCEVLEIQRGNRI